MDKDKELELIHNIKQRNHIVAEIVKVKRMIETLGDNRRIICYLASLYYTQDIYENRIKVLLA